MAYKIGWLVVVLGLIYKAFESYGTETFYFVLGGLLLCLVPLVFHLAKSIKD